MNQVPSRTQFVINGTKDPPQAGKQWGSFAIYGQVMPRLKVRCRTNRRPHSARRAPVVFPGPTS